MFWNIGSTAQLRQKSGVYNVWRVHNLWYGLLQTWLRWGDSFWQLGRPHIRLSVNKSSIEREWGAVTLKSRRQINISGNYTSIEQRQHSISNIILCYRRRVSERIVSKLFRQNSLRLVCLLCVSLTNSKFLELNITNATLTPAILELVWWSQSELLPDQLMTV